MFENVLMEPATLRLALVHHPLNWYAQSSYHDLRKKLRGHCNAIFSGHEHTATISTIRDFGVADNLTFEADALQPHSATEVPGFSLAIFDLAADSVEITPFNISRNNTIDLPLIKECLGGFLNWSETIPMAS